MSYTKAIEELREEQETTGRFEYVPEWGKSLQSEHERWLARTGPVFVTDYPAAVKPFYMRMNEDGKTVGCFDLLMPGVGELAGGSLREERYSRLEEALEGQRRRRAEEGNVGDDDEDELGWYLELRRYGGAPHGGFGMGFERLVCWLSGIDNIRESIAMPRWAGKMLL